MSCAIQYDFQIYYTRLKRANFFKQPWLAKDYFSRKNQSNEIDLPVGFYEKIFVTGCFIIIGERPNDYSEALLV